MMRKDNTASHDTDTAGAPTSIADWVAANPAPPRPPAWAPAPATPHAEQAAYGAIVQAWYHYAGAPMPSELRDRAHEAAHRCAADAVRYPGGASPVQTAAGLGVACGIRMAVNHAAQQAGTADAFGLDPAARAKSWAARYDGAV